MKKLSEAIVRPGDLSTMTMYRVTPGFLKVMSDSTLPVVGGLLMGQEAADELGGGDVTYRQVSLPTRDVTGSTPEPPAQTLPIRRVNLAPRGNFYARSLMALGPSSAMTGCR